MPIKRVKSGWKYGTTGKVYPTKKKAIEQMKAIKVKKRGK